MISGLKWILKIAIIFCFIAFASSGNQGRNLPAGSRSIAVIWSDGRPAGEVQIKYGIIGKIWIAAGAGKVQGNRFSFRSEGETRIEMEFTDINIKPGSGSTLVTINSEQDPFSFFLRDVNSDFPIYIPEYKVMVIPASDARKFVEIEQAIEDRNLVSKLRSIESGNEESFESASSITRDQSCPAWLGIGRDIRIFETDHARRNEAHEFELITPRLAAEPVRLPQMKDEAAVYAFATGRGQGPVLDSKRSLENGIMPILHTTIRDEDITYSCIGFTSLEKSPLISANNKGTHFLVADHYSFGHMFTEAQQAIVDEKVKEFENRREETVLYYRIVAENHASVPRYAWYKTPRPGRGWWSGFSWEFESSTGFSAFDDGMIFCISKLNGAPMPDEEMAVMLNPGEKAVFEFFLPHSPISRQRAEQLLYQTFDQRYRECKQYWESVLGTVPSIQLPEKRIQEMLCAGLLHLNLVTYGNEPGGTLAPCIGVYSPIGTESSPIVQFYSSMGWHDVAKRSLQYFLDKQHDDGMIQNFGGYMIETGAALWSMGEYFRHTHDVDWARTAEPKLLKACEFLINWRNRNKDEKLKSKGYGMIAGKVADPNDDYHQFMLNAYAYLGMKRTGEILRKINSPAADRIESEAVSWKADIRESFFHSMAGSPVVPLGDGTWCPTAPPWTESTGPQMLYADKWNSFSHGTFTVRDVMLGPMYLIFCEVLDPDETASKMMLNYHTELFYQNNAAFSQPYYSRHAWLELKRGLVKPFLKTYYTTVSALADRETYTFWEHIYHVSPHKTHEEGWFLMQTRWMLFMEDGNTLKLLPGIPRKWLATGEGIEIENMSSYFGPFMLRVKPDVEKGMITADITCNSERKPAAVLLRVPHPGYLKAKSVTGGTYDPETETVRIESFTGTANIVLRF